MGDYLNIFCSMPSNILTYLKNRVEKNYKNEKNYYSNIIRIIVFLLKQ